MHETGVAGAAFVGSFAPPFAPLGYLGGAIIGYGAYELGVGDKVYDWTTTAMEEILRPNRGYYDNNPNSSVLPVSP
jgi:hypothetical protein